jgi:hypothetical protein
MIDLAIRKDEEGALFVTSLSKLSNDQVGINVLLDQFHVAKWVEHLTDEIISQAFTINAKFFGLFSRHVKRPKNDIKNRK